MNTDDLLGPAPKVRRPCRGKVLDMIVASIREEVRWITKHPGWEQGDRFSSSVWAYREAIKIVNKHRAIGRDGRVIE